MNLSKPVTIRGIQFPNRVVMPPMQVGLGMRGAKARAYYLERAKGGAGTIIMAATSVDAFARDEAWGKAGAVDSFVTSLRPFLSDIQKTGARIGIQLWHGNQLPAGIGTPNEKQEAIAPSDGPDGRELTVAEIQTIISRFAKAAANAKLAGFDFVEVHGAHGYLVCQFFSSATNRRTDRYGGGLAGRMRFGSDCVIAMRAAVGEKFPIFYRLGAWEDIPGGITVEESAQFAAQLEKAGADVIDVSLGRMSGTSFGASPGPEQPEGTFASLAEAVKKRVKVPVIAVGRFKTPRTAEDVLASGQADMVAVGRQLIADPCWPKKAMEGRNEDIVPCISCNACFQTGLAGLGLKCSVNPAAGRENELPLQPAPTPKKVVVIGGGPAGMEAALTAARRGHKVSLFEKQNELGGQLIAAAAPPYKNELASLARSLANQVRKSGVRVSLGMEVDAGIVGKEEPDAVVLATGSVPLVPEIPGTARNKVVTALDVLTGKASTGEKVVVIGGELVGCETADFLSEQGKKLTVVRRGPEMAGKMYPSNRQALLSRLKRKKVTMITGIKQYKEITEAGLVVVDSGGKTRTLEADTIVIAAGAVRNDLLAQDIRSKVKEVHLAGDCVEPRRVLEAIHEGARLGREI